MTSTTSRDRVLIVEDDPTTRLGLTELVGAVQRPGRTGAGGAESDFCGHSRGEGRHPRRRIARPLRAEPGCGPHRTVDIALALTNERYILWFLY